MSKSEASVEWVRTEADRQAIQEGYQFDLAAAERVREFFRKFLRHSKGQWAGQPFEFLDWQWQDVIAPLFGWKRPDGTRRYRRGYIEVPKKNGKAQCLEEGLPTPTGWTTVDQVRVGDEVLAADGSPTRVIAKSPIFHDDPCYRVCFSRDSTLVVNARHEWTVFDIDRQQLVTIETHEIAKHHDNSTRIRYWLPEQSILELVAMLPMDRDEFGPWLSRSRRIIDAELWSTVPTQCIQVSAPNGLYLAGEGKVPTHNSSLFSGLSLYLLMADNEPGAEIYSAAVDRDQASIVFNEAANMVEQSPQLASPLSVVRSTKRIVFQRTRSFYKALSADVPAKEGLNAHAVLIDELHAQKTRDLWDTLRYAGASRRQPLHLSITTAGYDRHSICWEQHDYAAKVLDGTIQDLSFFAYISAAGDEDDWTDPEVWRRVNPSFGVTIDPEQFAEDCREAKESPAKENSFRRYRLNQWTEQDVRWLSMEKWDACGSPLENLASRQCYAGLDLSSTTDVSALVLVFPGKDRYDVLPFFWVPEEGARQRERRDRVPYLQWVREGLMEATPGEVMDYDVIRRRINELNERYQIREIAIDRWNATQLATQLDGDGFEIVAFGQGYASMNAPTKKLEEVVLAAKLAHGGHPVLRWMAGNVSIETDAADNWKPSKKRSTERIDGIVALIMALDRAMRHKPPRRSIYSRYGILTA